ncbi:WG repeat-containing protein [Paenibacillus wulumuqiensis]|uniref:WG repeat-containing protein n=1 Tax=Paenibacillus wulumuqiensis TaxID=1567107 RepID=UPI000697EB28|nr:WG repeat-containing protein [Paenibacillus wulumuqiensis]
MKGKVVIPFQYASAESFSEGLGAVYNKQDKMMIGYQYTKASSFADGIAAVGIKTKTGSKFGYINNQGKLLTPLQYQKAHSFNEGTAIALTSDQLALILSK